MIWEWIKSFLSSEPSFGHQGPLAATDPDWKGSKCNVQGLMTQSPVQHMPNNMIYLLWKVGIGSGALPRKIKSIQGQSNKVRLGKSGDPKLTCFDT